MSVVYMLYRARVGKHGELGFSFPYEDIVYETKAQARGRLIQECGAISDENVIEFVYEDEDGNSRLHFKDCSGEWMVWIVEHRFEKKQG